MGEQNEASNVAGRLKPAAVATPRRNPPIDLRTLRTMMGTAAYHAGRVARTMRLGESDREDVEQDILLALIERRRFFDPALGAWSSFADRVARQAAQVAADSIAADRRVRGGSLDEPVGDDAPASNVAVESCISFDGNAESDTWFRLTLMRFVAELPAELMLVTRVALSQDGDLAEAQRQSGLSRSEFYRRLQDIRYRLVCAGIVRKPPATTP